VTPPKMTALTRKNKGPGDVVVVPLLVAVWFLPRKQTDFVGDSEEVVEVVVCVPMMTTNGPMMTRI